MSILRKIFGILVWFTLFPVIGLCYFIAKGCSWYFGRVEVKNVATMAHVCAQKLKADLLIDQCETFFKINIFKEVLCK